MIEVSGAYLDELGRTFGLEVVEACRRLGRWCRFVTVRVVVEAHVCRIAQGVTGCVVCAIRLAGAEERSAVEDWQRLPRESSFTA